MDRRERSGELLAALLAMQESWQAQVWTAMPGIVQSFDVAKRTCVIQPSINAQVMDATGAKRWVQMPLLVDCPVIFPGGGGFVMTFPLALGDECLVIFASRCIDAWWQSGGSQVQAELRMHDLSDGFCLPGPRSVPNVEPAISAVEVQLRNTAGTRGIRLSTSQLELVAPGASVLLTDNTVTITGTLIINGEAYTAHKHTGVTVGTGITGGKA